MLGGISLEDYIPQNIGLIRNRGIQISKLRGGAVGLTVGLNPKRDILSHQILGLPDLGAIELPSVVENTAR